MKKIITWENQIKKMKEVAGCDATYTIIGNVVHYIYYIHFKDEEISAMPIIIKQKKINIIQDIKRYLQIIKEVKRNGLQRIKKS